ncbi:hypothetical protein [Streptomyces stackebrandtii]|uniref:hypothetical protein n=1 Tax=Streptomyces stackebrandtii TaxID=3051177 RepID=UPI0028DCFF67|nr:hypothetical protein [Streptomyces sp. DSM 40976]
MVTEDGSVIEEPGLAMRHRSADSWSRRSLILLFLPVPATALTGLATLAVSGNLLLPFERVITLEGKTAWEGR